MAQHIRAHCKIHGTVQGVGFRYWADRMAHDLKLVGWVKNCDDGTVEAVFEGTEDNVIEMVRRAQKGPPGSKVAEVDSKIEAATGEFELFKIK